MRFNPFDQLSGKSATLLEQQCSHSGFGHSAVTDAETNPWAQYQDADTRFLMTRLFGGRLWRRICMRPGRVRLTETATLPRAPRLPGRATWRFVWCRDNITITGITITQGGWFGPHRWLHQFAGERHADFGHQRARRLVEYPRSCSDVTLGAPDCAFERDDFFSSNRHFILSSVRPLRRTELHADCRFGNHAAGPGHGNLARNASACGGASNEPEARIPRGRLRLGVGLLRRPHRPLRPARG